MVWDRLAHIILLKICDQICQNQPSLHQVTRHTFHHQSIVTPMELTIHLYTIANDSLVCFSWHCFLWPVWHAWVLGWSSNGSCVNRQVTTQLEITTILTRKLGHQTGYCLWYLELEWASGETFWQVNFNTWLLNTFVSPHHPCLMICDSVDL